MELRALPSEVISKLRSGVAIVSIAHCMEELVLNALDAGATCVAVRLNLPYHKVQVVDNGHGMSKDQLSICGERYSTSKCRTISDLEHPKFYGYRGEAIASLADMSGGLQIESRTVDSEKSYCKIFARGKLLKLCDSSTIRPSVGTTVTVLDFMYNLPVRRYSVSETIDFEFCLQQLEGLALSHPAVSFTLRNDITGEKCFQTHKGSSVLGMFAQLFGKRKACSLKRAVLTRKKLHIEAYFSMEGHTSKRLQFVYLNRRLLLKTRIHKLVHNVLKKYALGFHLRPGSLESSPSRAKNKHPVFIVFMECFSRIYDITFEPRKTLVEFANWDMVTEAFEKLLNSFLLEHQVISHGFVISGDLPFSQKAADKQNEIQSPMQTVAGTSAEDVSNALISMKARRSKCIVTVSQPKEAVLKDLDNTGAEDPLSVQSRQCQSLGETTEDMPVGSFVGHGEWGCSLPTEDKELPRASIVLPPSFAHSSEKRVQLRISKEDPLLDIGRRFRFNKQKVLDKEHTSKISRSSGRHSVSFAPNSRVGLSGVLSRQKEDAQQRCKPAQVSNPTVALENESYKQRNGAPLHDVFFEGPTPLSTKLRKKMNINVVESATAMGNGTPHLQRRSYFDDCENLTYKPNEEYKQTALRDPPDPAILPARTRHTMSNSSSNIGTKKPLHFFAAADPYASTIPPKVSRIENELAHRKAILNKETFEREHMFDDGDCFRALTVQNGTQPFVITQAFETCLPFRSDNKACGEATGIQSFQPLRIDSDISNSGTACAGTTMEKGLVSRTITLSSSDCESAGSVESNIVPPEMIPFPDWCSPKEPSSVVQCGQTMRSSQTTEPAPSSFLLSALSLATETGQSNIFIEGADYIRSVPCNAQNSMGSVRNSEIGDYPSLMVDNVVQNHLVSLVEEYSSDSTDHCLLPGVESATLNRSPLFVGQDHLDSTKQRLHSQVNSTVQNRLLSFVEEYNSDSTETDNKLDDLTQTSPERMKQQQIEHRQSSQATSSPLEWLQEEKGFSSLPLTPVDVCAQVSEQAHPAKADSSKNTWVESDPQEQQLCKNVHGSKWMAWVDPASGQKMFIDSTSGNSTFFSPPSLAESNQATETVNMDLTMRLHPLPTSSLTSFLPRPQAERVQFKVAPDPAMTDLVKAWNNPAFLCDTLQDIVDAGLHAKSAGVTASYRVTQSYKFTKEMLNHVKVIGQVDAKFVACLMPVCDKGMLQDDRLVVLFDQHAAHERSRLEWLLKNQHEGQGPARSFRSSGLNPHLTLSLEPDVLRRISICEKELSRLGVHCTVSGSSVVLERLPSCLIEREASERRCGRPSILAARAEELLKEHTETLLTTRRSAISWPKVVLDILSSQACHGAIKFGSVLERAECCKILKALSRCNLPFQCAHGRPSLTPIVDLRFLLSEKACSRPNFSRITAKLNTTRVKVK